MNDQDTPQGSSSQGEPPAGSPPPQSPQPGAAGASSNRNLMVALSYLWILFLVPLLVEKEDKEVQWHAKHGLVITGLEIVLHVVLSAISATGIGCLFAIFIPVVLIAFLVVRIICIVKGINGERFIIPGVSQYADRF